jgi:hypothetical protein
LVMEKATIEELKRRRSSIEEELAANRKATKAFNQQKRDEAKKSASCWRLGTWLTHVAVILVVRANGITDPAVRMLCVAAQRRQWPAKPEEEIRAMVEDLIYGMGYAELFALCEDENPTDLAAFKAAVRWSWEWELFLWVDKLNTNKGLAPSTGQVLLRAEKLRQELPERHRPVAIGTAAQSSSRMWAFRWRKRWGGRHGKIRVRDEISVDEMRAKASILTC